MSIYATLWKLKFPKDGDDYPGCEWVTVTAQSVASHIGSPTPGGGYEHSDPFAAFLPPPVRTNDDGESGHLRAVVFVTEKTRKGTDRSPQEYVDPLLVVAGETYANMLFGALHACICDALRGDKPRAIVTSILSDGRAQVFFDDGTSKEIPR